MPGWAPVTPQYFTGSGWINSDVQYWDGSNWQPAAVQVFGDVPVDTLPPVVAFTSPAAGATISATQTVTGTVSDDVAVDHLAISAGGVQLGNATITGTTWSIDIDTTQLANGNVTVTATGVDAAANSAVVTRAYVVGNTVSSNQDITGPYVQPTYTQSASSTITGTLVLPNDAKLTYLGVDSVSDPGTFPGFYRPPFIVGTTATIPAYSVKFNFSGQSLEVNYQTHTSGEEIRVVVNGKWQSQTTTAPYRSTAGSGVATWLKLDFGSAASRTIQIDIRTWFGGIKVTSAGQITQAGTPTFKAIILSDSLAGATNKGSGDNSGYYTAISSYALQMAENVNWQHRYNESIGGSGFTVNGDGGGTGTYIGRIPTAVNARNPNAVYFDAHMLNDFQASKTATQVSTALDVALSSMRTALPNANIVCALTPLAPAFVAQLGSVATATSTVKSFNDPMLAVAARYAAYVIDPLDGRVYDTDGSFLGNPNGGAWQMPTGTTYPSTYMTSDGVHPTREGSWVFANQCSAALDLIMAQASWQGARGDVNTPADTTPPTVPGLQTPSVTTTSVTLTWTAASDPGGVAGYNVYRGGTKQNTTLVTGLTYTQSGLAASTTYGPYQVTAVDNAGNESGPSVQQTATTSAVASDTTPPTTPTALTVTPTNGGFQALWAASSDLVGVSGYRVYVDNVVRAQSVTVTNYTAAGLTNGQSYSVQVTAFDAAGNESPRTTAVPVTPAVGAAPNPPTGVAVVPGDGQLRITWTAPAAGTVPTGYSVFLGGVKQIEERVPSTIIDGLVNGTTYSVRVASFDGSGNLSAQTAAVSDTPQTAQAMFGAPAEVFSYGPNGTHYIDRTPYLFNTVGTVIECACTWAAIKTAVNSLTDAQVNAGARVNVQPGTLPGSGASAGSAPMMDTVGKLAWRKRVLVTPRDGIGSISFSGDFRINKVFNVAFVNWDTSPYSAQMTGCSYSGICRYIMGAWRLSGLNTMLTEGFDAVEWVIRDVKVVDLDPSAWGSGYSATGDYTKGNAWLRYCRSIGGYIAPSFLPIDTFDANGKQLTGLGHNDSLQFYGNGNYYGFTIRDSVHFGCDNCALQIGGWRVEADAEVGPIPYFMKLSRSLLLQVGVGVRVRYPVPATSKSAGTGGSSINGIGRNGQHYADQVIAPGSLYTTNWATVSNSRGTVSRPSVVGAWTVDAQIANWTRATYDRICPVPDDNRLTQIWSEFPPAQTPPTIPAIGATS